jgi:hypothetical protein
MAAAVADPIVEFASNAGWFGSGSFTDGSNLSVVPVLAAGAAMLLLYMVRKARALVAEGVCARGIAAGMPLIFALQLITLYAMETTEQVAVRGHVLGPTVWLGGPVLYSLAIHALCCLAVTLWMARSARRLAETTLRVMRLFETFARLAAGVPNTIVLRPYGERSFNEYAPLFCRIGERAPPVLQT